MAADEIGLQSELSKKSLLLGEAFKIADAKDVTHLFHQMQAFEKEYLATRQRPHMQSAFNIAVLLKEAITLTPSFKSEEKTEVLRIGTAKNYNNILCPNIGLKWTKGPVKLLGVQVSTDLTQLEKLNYSPILQKL